jgi:hypothetical protein
MIAALPRMAGQARHGASFLGGGHWALMPTTEPGTGGHRCRPTCAVLL